MLGFGFTSKSIYAQFTAAFRALGYVGKVKDSEAVRSIVPLLSR